MTFVKRVEKRQKPFFDLLWEIGFRPVDSMVLPDFRALELRYLGLPDDFG